MNHSANELIEHNLKAWMALKSFEKGDLSLGQLAENFGKSKIDTMQMLGQLKIPIADYDLQEDLDTVEKLFSL